jgi:SAM-dependent methyltransferase
MIQQPEDFEEIYHKGGWDGQGSGPGSTESFTREFRGVLEGLLREKGIKSMFDLGCGDWQWQRHVKWGDVDYVGWDISSSAIESIPRDLPALLKSRSLFARDAFTTPLWPEADLLIVKDVVHHISPWKVRMLVEKAKLYDYVLLVADIDVNLNWPVNWPQSAFTGEHLMWFDTSLPYPYGPKAAFLRTNP